MAAPNCSFVLFCVSRRNPNLITRIQLRDVWALQQPRDRELWRAWARDDQRWSLAVHHIDKHLDECAIPVRTTTIHQYLERLLRLHRPAVRAVRCHSVVCVGDRDNARLFANVDAAESAWV